MDRRLIYRCSPSIVWVRDADRTLVLDEETGQSWILQSVETVVWDLLALDYPYQRIVLMLSLILSISAEEAESTLVSVLRQWQGAGIVQVSGGTDGGELGRQCGV